VHASSCVHHDLFRTEFNTAIVYILNTLAGTEVEWGGGRGGDGGELAHKQR
jgi:hypothetical protein